MSRQAARILAFGGAEFEQQGFAGRGLALEFSQPGPEFLELTASHGAFLGHAFSRACQHVKFPSA
jgi:hypothetical protein